MKRILSGGLLLLALAWAQGVELKLVVGGFDKPIFITQAPGGSLLVLEQIGRIMMLAGGKKTVWLDVQHKVNCCGERGLLSLAFHPDYARNRRFFISYIDRRGHNVIEEYRSGQPYRVLLTIKQPAAKNNGGHIAFGPDGYLYIGIGDGGGGVGDPKKNAQNPRTFLGKMLRIDVDHGNPYAIPGDNPFLANPRYRPEIWALGFRNPWRFSFDRVTGDLFIGDTGQKRWEEIDYVPAPMGSGGGWNFGWNILEGNHCFKPPKNCQRAKYIPSILEYSHSQGCSVTGGYVYRGKRLSGLSGAYLYGDYCSGNIWVARWQGGRWQSRLLLKTKMHVVSFGEDAAGELYVVDHGGSVYRLSPAR